MAKESTARPLEAVEIDDERPTDKAAHPPAAMQRFAEDDLVPRMMIPIEEAKARLAELQKFVREVMVEGTHYGPPFPNSTKQVLYKAGGELLMEVYGYAVDVHVLKRIEKWTAAEGGPFFHYEVEALIYSKRTGNFVGRGIGSCNTRENRYRWRQGERACPSCGQEAIIKGKAQYGGGWLCWKTKGGCGAKFAENDAAITDQKAGKVPNDDVETLVNTVLKIAKKRAYLDGAIAMTQSSGLFTIEDDSDGADDEDGAPAQQRTTTRSSGTTRQGGQQRTQQQAQPADGKLFGEAAHRTERVQVSGKTYCTAGVGYAALTQIWDLIRQFDKAQGKDTHRKVIAEVTGDAKRNSALDLTADTAQKAIARLQELLSDSDDTPPQGDDNDPGY